MAILLLARAGESSICSFGIMGENDQKRRLALLLLLSIRVKEFEEIILKYQQTAPSNATA